MEDVSICFVVLHYNTMEDTERFIASVFEKIDVKNYQIVVVDNASPDGSGNMLQKKYKDNEKVSVLLNDENAGFARGNNLGITYAEKNFDPDFIVMTNSDTYLIQEDFYFQIKREYENSRFFVLGPRIITRGAKAGRWIVREPYDRARTQKLIRSTKYHLIVNYCGIAGILSKIRTLIIDRPQIEVDTPDINERRENVYLEGACLIFSRDYISIYHGINPHTYMYFEEEILFYEMTRDGRKIVYNPKVKIFHNSHSATEKTFKKRRQYMLFRCRNQLQSAKVLLDIIDGKIR